MKINEFTICLHCGCSQEIVDKHTLDNTDIYFKMNSLIGELGELANIFKKERFYYEFESYKKRCELEVQDNIRIPFHIRVEDELGDVLFYVFQIINQLHRNAEELMIVQKDKLERYGEKYKGGKELFLK